MNFVDDFTATFFVTIAFFCSFDVESIVSTFEFSMYLISIPYTSSSSVIGIYIVPSLFSACEYVFLFDPFMFILFFSRLIDAILLLYVVTMLLFSLSSYIYLSKKFPKSCFDIYMLLISVN